MSYYDIDEIFKSCENELKIDFNLFSNRAGRSGAIGWAQGEHQDANRRTDQLNIKVFLQFNLLWVMWFWNKYLYYRHLSLVSWERPTTFPKTTNRCCWIMIIMIMVLQACFQIANQAVREREMSTNRDISGIDNVSTYTSRYIFELGIRVLFCDVCKSKSLCDVYIQ